MKRKIRNTPETERFRHLKNLLKVIIYLRENTRTYQDIMEEFEISQRTARRYIKVLRECNLPIEIEFDSLGAHQGPGCPALISLNRRWKL